MATPSADLAKVAAAMLEWRRQRTGIQLPAQQPHLGVSLVKIASEPCNHVNARDNVLVEGRVSMRKICAGSGAGLGHGTVGGGAALGIEAQPLKAVSTTGTPCNCVRCGPVRKHSSALVIALSQAPE